MQAGEVQRKAVNVSLGAGIISSRSNAQYRHGCIGDVDELLMIRKALLSDAIHLMVDSEGLEACLIRFSEYRRSMQSDQWTNFISFAV